MFQANIHFKISECSEELVKHISNVLDLSFEVGEDLYTGKTDAYKLISVGAKIAVNNLGEGNPKIPYPSTIVFVV